jgi:hypothetical protein
MIEMSYEDKPRTIIIILLPFPYEGNHSSLSHVELGDTIDNCISTLPEKCGVTYMVMIHMMQGTVLD